MSPFKRDRLYVSVHKQRNNSLYHCNRATHFKKCVTNHFKFAQDA